MKPITNRLPELDAPVKQALIDHLTQFVTRHKQDLIEQVLNQRTRHLTVVLEDIYQTHNASAVVRSCECFGVQDIHIIERRNTFQFNPDVIVGAGQWVTLKRYHNQDKDNTTKCLQSLKQQGYHIAAMTLRHPSQPIQDLPLEAKLALCFGTEEQGLSDEAHDLADYFVRIPMYGFTQSFNISVTVALSLFALVPSLHASAKQTGLTEEEKQDLRLQWLINIVNRSDIVVRTFLKQRGFDLERG